MKTKLLSFLFFFVLIVCFSQDKAIDSLKAVLQVSNSNIEKAKANNALADIYKRIDPNEVIIYANIALELSQEHSFPIQKGFAFINLGNGNIIKGNYSKSLEYFHTAKSVFEIALENKDDLETQKGLAKAYGSIGVVSSEQSNYVKAFQYYLKSIAIYEALEDKQTLSKLYNNVGVAYKSQGE